MESRRKARIWKYNHSISLWYKDLLDISAIEHSDFSFTVFSSTVFCSRKHFCHLFLFCLRMGLVQPGGLSYPEFVTVWPAASNCVGFSFLFGCSLNSLHLRPFTWHGRCAHYRCNSIITHFRCSSHFHQSEGTSLQEVRARGSHGVLGHKAFSNSNGLLGTNKSAIYSSSAIWEHSEKPGPRLPHLATEPLLFKWSLKLEF